MSLEHTQNFHCPYCNGGNSIAVTPVEGSRQRFPRDCEVCCRPLVIRVEFDGENLMSFEAAGENA